MKTTQEVANSDLGQTIARTFTDNSSSHTVSLGSNPQYLEVERGMNYTYFNMPTTALNVIRTMPDHFGRGMNTAFINHQMLEGKEFVSSLGNPAVIGQGLDLELGMLRQSIQYTERFFQYFDEIEKAMNQNNVFNLRKDLKNNEIPYLKAAGWYPSWYQGG